MIQISSLQSVPFDLAGYMAYRRAKELEMSPLVWTLQSPDHMRLPGAIDITEFLICIGFIFERWLIAISYTGEKLLFSPKYPDIIYSYTGSVPADVTADSPHVKIPMSIAYGIRKRMPASVDSTMFGRRKNWKYRKAGEFRGSDGNVYSVRIRQWENLVEFVLMARSGAEADALCQFFENFMSLNEKAFLEAGVEKMVPVGRIEETESTLRQANVHYRKTFFWFRTQEFQIAGPVTTISTIEAEVLNAAL